MSDTTTQAPPADASGAAPPPTGDGTSGAQDGQAAADAFAAEREQFEQQIRELNTRVSDFQGRYDRLAAERKPEPKPADSSSGALTAEQMRAEFARMSTLASTVSELRGSEDVKHAHPSLFGRAHEFDSPEAFRVAVEESHRERAALIEAGRQAALKEAGVADTASLPPTDSGSTAGTTGTPTKQQLAAFTQQQYEAFVAKNGEEAVQAILRS